MPDVADHVAKAIHNERFADHLGVTRHDYPDWIVTARFYTAVHLVDSVLARPLPGIHPTRHRGDDRRARAFHMERDPRLSSIFEVYRELENLSHLARYTNEFVDPQQIEDSANALEEVRNHIQVLVPELPPSAAS